MEQKPNNLVGELSFRDRVLVKPMVDLLGSISWREGKLQEYQKQGDHKKADSISGELQLFYQRKNDLDRLAEKSDLKGIEGSIAHRQAIISGLGFSDADQIRKKSLEVEIEVLKQTKTVCDFRSKIKNKSPSELEQSIRYRDRLIAKRELPPDQLEQLIWEINELKSKLEREKSPTASSLKKIPKNPNTPYESIGSREKIGHHGVILTPLVERGVVIDGVPLRQGNDGLRIVSGKSESQYTYDLGRIFEDTSPDPLLEGPRKNRRKLLRLIGCAYCAQNPEIQTNLHQLAPAPEADIQSALGYMRHLVEQRVGGAIETDFSHGKHDVDLLKVLYHSMSDVSQIGSSDVLRLITTTLPNGKTNDIETEDTFRLGLLLRQFAQNAKARQEHRLDGPQGLVTLFTK